MTYIAPYLLLVKYKGIMELLFGSGIITNLPLCCGFIIVHILLPE